MTVENDGQGARKTCLFRRLWRIYTNADYKSIRNSTFVNNAKKKYRRGSDRGSDGENCGRGGRARWGAPEKAGISAWGGLRGERVAKGARGVSEERRRGGECGRSGERLRRDSGREEAGRAEGACGKVGRRAPRLWDSGSRGARATEERDEEGKTQEAGTWGAQKARRGNRWERDRKGDGRAPPCGADYPERGAANGGEALKEGGGGAKSRMADALKAEHGPPFTRLPLGICNKQNKGDRGKLFPPTGCGAEPRIPKTSACVISG